MSVVLSKGSMTARVARNTGWGVVAQLLARGAQVILFLLLSRTAGANQAGILTIGITYLTIAGRLAAWGLDQILMRDIAHTPQALARYTSNFLLLRILLAMAAWLLLALLLPLAAYPPDVNRLILLVTLSVLPEGIINLCQAIFTAYERMGEVAALGALAGASKILLGWLALRAGYGIDGVVWALLASNLLVTVVSLLWLTQRYATRPWRIEWDFCWQQMVTSAPFVLIAGAYILDNQADTLVLSWLLPPADVGIYGAASTVIVGLGMLPQAFRDAILPALSRAFHQDQVALQRLYRQSLKYLLVMGLPITGALLVLSEPILRVVFGKEFVAATSALQILAIVLLMQFILVPHNRLLVVANQQNSLSLYLFLGLIVNVATNFLLSPKIGIAGAAWGRLVSILLVFALIYWRLFHWVYTVRIGDVWIRPLLAALCMTGLLWWLAYWNPWLALMGGGIVYAGLLLVFGVFSQQELARLPSVFMLRK